MWDDDNYLIPPSLCEIKNLKIVSRDIKNLGGNQYSFQNNIVSLNKEYLIQYEMFFYKYFYGDINFTDVLWGLIPKDFLTSEAKALFNIGNNDNNKFFALRFISDSVEQNFNIDAPSNGSEGEATGSGNEEPEVTELPEGEGEVIDIPWEFPEVAEYSGEVGWDAGEKVSIEKFCKISPRVAIFTINFETNSIEITSFANINISNCLIENNSIPIIPCGTIEGCWGYDEDNAGIFAIFSKTREITKVREKAVKNDGTEELLARLTLNPALSNTGYYVNDITNSTLVFFSNLDINIQNTIKIITIDNILTAWGSNSLALIDSNGAALDVSSYTVSYPSGDGGYIQISQGANIIWYSNYFDIFLIAQAFITPIRYYVTRRLGDLEYVRVSSPYSPYILLKIKLVVTASIDKFTIKMGRSSNEASSQDTPIFFEHEEEMEGVVKNFSVIYNINGNPIIEKERCYFNLQLFNDDQPIEMSNGNIVECVEAKVEAPPLNIEPTGVGIGVRSSSTAFERKFEVGASYTTHFYGKVEIFPVGAIYLSVTPENPGIHFYGDWVRWGEGRMPIGVKESDTSAVYQTAEQLGGEKEVTLSLQQIPPHKHTFRRYLPTGSNTGTSASRTTGSKYTLINTNSAGGISSTQTQPHNNMPPFITCYMWKRIR